MRYETIRSGYNHSSTLQSYSFLWAGTMGATRVFRVFVSSTFTDMIEERNILHKLVFPRIHQLCVEQSARFQPIDLRWGVSDEAGYNQQTMNICLGEIKRCQETTRRPNMIVLLGDRYGWQPLPYSITVAEFVILLDQITSTDDRDLLSQWYKLDKNAVPPLYVLQPREGEFAQTQEWRQVEAKLQTILQAAARHLTVDQQMKYSTSATAQEIEQAIFYAPEPGKSAFCFFRTITDLTDHLHGSDVPSYVDLDENGGINPVAQEKLRRLKQQLRNAVPDNIREYKVAWEHRQDYLRQLCDDVEGFLRTSILEELSRDSHETDPLQEESAAHLNFARHKARYFVGRQPVIEQVNEYLRHPLNKPLVLFGASGGGKTTVMSRLVSQIQMTYPQTETICRFIGVTPHSSDIRALLEGMCREIAERYQSNIPVPPDYRELVPTLASLLGEARSDKPLLILLDALDQLSTLNNAHELDWLPQNLPDHVAFICSTIPGTLLERLRAYSDKIAFVEVGPMPTEEGSRLLQMWLAEDRRILQPEQEAAVLTPFTDNGSPLYLRLAYEEARLWNSYTPAATLNPEVTGIICDNLFRRLEEASHHGYTFVSHALAYLVAGRNGVSEDELLAVLTQDDVVWAELTATSEHHKHTIPARQLPFVIWSRLYYDLQPYLSEYAGDGVSLLGFYHRQLREVATQTYLTVQFHRQLARYFAEQSTYDAAHLPNLRKLTELPYQHFQGRQQDELCKLLTGTSEWMEAQFASANSDTPYIQDLDMAISEFTGSSSPENVVKLFAYWTARQVVNVRVNAYTDDNLKRLVYLNKSERAISMARLRKRPEDRVEGLLAIYEAQRAQGTADVRLVNEPIAIIRQLPRGNYTQMSSSGIFHQIVSVLCEIGSYDLALTLLREDVLGLSHSSASEILTAMFQAGRQNDALAALNEIKDEYERKRAIVDLANLLEKSDLPTDTDVGHELLADARRLEDPIYRRETLQKIASVLRLKGETNVEPVLEEAVAATFTISIIEGYNSRSAQLESLVTDFVEVGALSRAWELTHEISDPEKRIDALQTIATRLAEQGDTRAEAAFEEALAVVRTFKPNRSFDYRSNPLVPLVTKLLNSGFISRALELAPEIQHETERIQIFCDAAVALARTNDPKATEVFTAALDYAASLTSPWNRVFALGEISTAMQLVGDSRVESILLEVYTLWHKANDENAKETVHRVKYRTISTLLDAKHFDHALRCAERLEADEKAESLIEIYNVLSQAGDARADEILSQALSATNELQDDTSYHNTRIIEHMVSVLEKAGLYSAALQVADKIPSKTRWLSARLPILAALGESGDVRFETLMTETFISALDIETDWDYSSSQEEVLNWLRKAGHPVVESIYTRLYERVTRNEPLGNAAPVLGVVAQALSQAGDFELALNLARSITNPRNQPSVLSFIANSILESGDSAFADTIFTEAVSVTKKIDDTDLYAYTLENIAGDIIQSGSSLAESVFQEVLAAKEQVENERIMGESLAAFAAALAQAKEFERAWYVVSEIPEEDDTRTSRSAAFGSIATALAAAGRFEDAFVTSWQSESLTHQRESLTAAVNALTDQQTDNALQLLGDAWQIAQNMDDAEERTSALCAVGAGMATLGDDRARIVFQQAIAGIPQITYNFQKYRTISRISARLSQCYIPELQPVLDLLVDTTRATDTQKVERYSSSDASSGLSYAAVTLAKTGDARAEELFAEAIQRARENQDEKQRLAIFEVIAECLAEAGMFANALAVAQEIADDERRWLALYMIAKSQTETGQIESALMTARSIVGTWQRGEALNCAAEHLVEIDPNEAKSLLSEALGVVSRSKHRLAEGSEHIRSLLNLSRTMRRVEHPSVSDALQEALKIAQAVDFSMEQTRDDVIPMAKYNVLRDMAEAGFFMDILTADLRVDEFYGILKFFGFVCEIIPRLPPQYHAVQAAILADTLRIIGWKNSLCQRLHKTFSSGDVSVKALKPLAHAQSMYYWGRLYSLRGNYALARDAFDQAVQFAQGNEVKYAYFWGWRGETHRMLNNYREAIADFDMVLQYEDDAAYWFWARGSSHYAMGNYDASLRDLSQSIAIQSDDSWVWWWHGQAYFAAGNYAKALEDYSHAIQLQPDQPLLYRQRIRLHLLLNDSASALEDADRLLQLSGDTAPNEDLAFGFYWRALVYIERLQWDEAAKDLQRCADLNEKVPLEIAFCDLWQGLACLCQYNASAAEAFWAGAEVKVNGSDVLGEAAQLRVLLALVRQDQQQIHEALETFLAENLKPHDLTRFEVYLRIIEKAHPSHERIRADCTLLHDRIRRT